MRELQVASGSLSDVAKRNKQSVAESFVNAEHIIIIDVSGSMNTADSRGGQRRYAVALQELKKLQAALSGQIAVIAFSDDAQFIPGGQPILLGGGTALHTALTFSKSADVTGMHFVVISDGEPDSESDALQVASTYTNRIDTVFVGSESDKRAQDFLRRLAKASGGQAVKAERVLELSERVLPLLAAR